MRYLVFCGDPDQLPSIGPGSVLRDIIGSGVITTDGQTATLEAGANAIT